MQIASQMAGFSLGQADLLRRAVGKKKREVLDEQRAIFVAGCLQKGYEERLAHEVYDLIVRFANYGFNRAHAAAYAVLAYQTCYLKANHPAAYMAALLSGVMASHRKVAQYVDDCRRMNIEVLPPDVNRSEYRFTVEDGKIRFGLLTIKHVGVAAIQNLVQMRRKRPFLSLIDFLERVDARACNKKAIESLIRAGCFDEMHGNRRAMLLALEETAEQGRLRQRDHDDSQMSLFGMIEEQGQASEEPFTLPKTGDFSERERLEMEKEYLGLYVSGSPLTPYRHQLERLADKRVIELLETDDGAQVTICGLLRSAKKIQTKKGARMAFLEVEDSTGIVEVVLFPEVFKRSEPQLQAEAIAVRGRLQQRGDELKVIADRLKALEPDREEFESAQQIDRPDPSDDRAAQGGPPDAGSDAPEREGEQEVVYLRIRPEDEQRLMRLERVIQQHPGELPVLLFYTATRKARALSARYAVAMTPEFVHEVEQLLDRGSVVKKMLRGEATLRNPAHRM